MAIQFLVILVFFQELPKQIGAGPINNDGLSDVIELDMNPEDNYRKKMMMGPNNYQIYQNYDYYGYQYQYVKNTLAA